MNRATRQSKRANVTDSSTVKRRKRTTTEEESLPSEDETVIDERQTMSTRPATRTCSEMVSSVFDPN